MAPPSSLWPRENEICQLSDSCGLTAGISSALQLNWADIRQSVDKLFERKLGTICLSLMLFKPGPSLSKSQRDENGGFWEEIFLPSCFQEGDTIPGILEALCKFCTENGWKRTSLWDLFLSLWMWGNSSNFQVVCGRIGAKTQIF